jgi:predicted ribosomally synthesized peptide with SipW-like signal peptide
MKFLTIGATLLLVTGSAFAAMSDEDQIKAALNDGCKGFCSGGRRRHDGSAME